MASIPLSTITEIIWKSIPTMGGQSIGIRMCRTDPAFPGYGQYDASINPAGGSFYNNKLYLDQTICPRLVSDLELSQAFQATNGKSQLDNLSLQFVDVENYTGLINSSGGPVANPEDFGGESTFFTEFFNDTQGLNYKKYPVMMWIDLFDGSGNFIEKSYLFHIDPNYKPQGQLISFSQNGYFAAYSRPEILRAGSLRTFQAVAAGAAFASVQFQATLNVLGGQGSGNFVQGAGYCGFMLQPPGSASQGGQNVAHPSDIFRNVLVGNYYMEATLYEASQVANGGPPSNLYNSVSPPYRPSGLLWPDGYHLPWDPNHGGQDVSPVPTGAGNFYGPCGTWWFNLGTLVSALCNSFGQLYASDGYFGSSSSGFTGSTHDFYSGSNQFSPNVVGQTITFSKPDNGGFATDTIASYVGVNHVTLTSSHTVTAINGPLSWFIKGHASAQILFDVNAQMGFGWTGMQIINQAPDNTNMCYPVDTALGAQLPSNIWISANAFLGSHPMDGSFWGNPVAFGATQTLDNILQGICNFLCCQYEIIVDATTGQARLILVPLGTSGGVFPKAWIPEKAFQEVEPSTGSTAVVVQNAGDNQQIMCPLGPSSESTTAFPVPIRLRTWGGATLGFPFGDSFLGFAPNGTGTVSNTLVQNLGGLVYDGGDTLAGQAQDCFMVDFVGAGGDTHLNTNCWKGLCYAMRADGSGNNTAYPTGNGTNWTPLENGGGSVPWAGKTGLTFAFYALGAQYGPGFTPIANEPNYQRFNSIDYQSVIFATYLIQLLGTILQRDYFGTTDDGTNGAAGSLSVLNVGMSGTWRYDISATDVAAGKTSRTFQVITLPRFLIANESKGIQLVEIQSSGFPDITAFTYGPLPGSSGSGETSGSGQGTGGGSIGPASATIVIGTATISANTDSPTWPVCDILRLNVIAPCELSGIVAGSDGQALTVTNVGVAAIQIENNASSTTANNIALWLMPDGTGEPQSIVPHASFTFRYDATIPAWQIESTSR